MFDQLKNFFSKKITPIKKTKEKKISTDKEKTKETPLSSTFEPSYIEPSSEPVIKRTQRNLKYRR